MFLTITGNAIAQKNKETNSPLIGSWKFSNQSKLNDFQKIFENEQQRSFKTEYFTFDSNHKFKHEFISKDDKVVKTLYGKWKSTGNKIKIDYSSIDYSLLLDYFFIDKDLVLGQNFNHIIFTQDNLERNVALK
jgi:hypothetical protein